MKKGMMAAIIAIAVVIIGGLSFSFITMGPVDKSDNKINVFTVEAGSGTAAIASNLKSNDLIKNDFVFRVVSKVTGSDGEYRAGSYAIKKSMSMKEIMDLLVSGKTTGKIFAIPEGNSIYKDCIALEQQGICSKEEFLSELTNGKFDYDFVKLIPKGENRFEGFLFPDQYQVDLEPTAHQVVDVMLKRFDNIFTDEYYKKAEEMDLSLVEVMTVASIVEKEAKTKEDKANVASVIYNRLKIGMPLQMDSILAYIHKEDKIKASLADTQVDHAYNPYKNKGLPPGPICSPGKDSIEAALNPAKTDYVYFVASEKLDGTNVFSVTYEDFLKDKAKFDKAYKEYIKKNPGKK